MKNFISTILFSLLLISAGHAQSLQTGIDWYEEGNYERALQVFEQINDPEAHLFAGKSHFALAQYFQAKNQLLQVESNDENLRMEAAYTSALADFQLKNFSQALDALYEIRQSSLRTSVYMDANQLYQDLLNYLSLEQRHNAFKATSFDQVRVDLMESAIGNVDIESARALFKATQRAVQSADTSGYRNIRQLLGNETAYNQRYNPNHYADAPNGIAYNIGVALPEFDTNSSEFEISQHLYFGIQLAVENFNSENSNQKAFITYRNTQSDVRQASAVANDFVWNYDVDAVIGPLFSEVATEFARYAEQYEVPMISPLANSDSLNLDYNYTFQLNPTFAVQGRMMAEYAVERLGYDTLAVIAERGALGESSAQAFLDESRKRGAAVVHYFVEDLEAEGYDISEYVKYFDPEVDTVFQYNIDAIYAPFTGTVANTLMSSLVTNLEAIGSNMTILGSEEWESVNIQNFGARSALYYTETFRQQQGTNPIENFKSAFRLRYDTEPNRFAYIGYDAATVLLRNLKKVQNPSYLRQGLKSFNNFQGLIMDVSFEGTHINQVVNIRRGSN
ncbi:ABC transporter substrate-binding protein [Gracilimonas mengyeensis]|uniref:ABC-type branched-chain amino acid transport system, substrate-binding protein n=1 Tax=Gracilimonas mengyeensis TaxID=1302730 RepID=A0A521AIT2_9BACT|nr:ABC transporter substrate-binding protein [Gracilimonas mengyeensis]SMO34661.1 ABC-type branched-chain amino acid transport system, substrate-binding protein [Gracilimonas mengyeensis]